MKRLIGAVILIVLVAIPLWFRRQPEIWLAASPYDEATKFEAKSDVAFCFQMNKDGRIDVAPSCLKRLWVSAPIKRCAVQNLDDKNWIPEVTKVDPHLIALNIHNLHFLGCSAILLDIEEVKSDYTPWMMNVLKELRKEWPSVLVSVPVYAKADAAGEWPPAAAQDWKKICELSDELLVMAYDYRTPAKGAPMTAAADMAPLDWVDKVVHYAVQECDPEKVRLGLAAYGYNWSTGARVTEHDYAADATLRSNPMVRVETAKERDEKISLGKKLGIYKFFLWTKGMQAASH